VQELVTLRGERKFKPRQQNRILVALTFLEALYKISDEYPRLFYIGVPPGGVNSTDKRELKTQTTVETIAMHTCYFFKFLARGCQRFVTRGQYREILPRVISQSNSRIQDSGPLRWATDGIAQHRSLLITFDRTQF